MHVRAQKDKKEKSTVLSGELTVYSKTLHDLRVVIDDLNVRMWLKFYLSKAPFTSYQQQNVNIQTPSKWNARFMGQ